MIGASSNHFFNLPNAVNALEAHKKKFAKPLIRPQEADAETLRLLEEIKANQAEQASAAVNTIRKAAKKLSKGSPNPIELQAKNVEKAAKKALKSENSSMAATSFSASLKSLTPSGVFAFLPFFFWMLYKSEEKHLHNIHVNINLTARQAYRISLGNDRQEMGISFEACPGKKLRFLTERYALTGTSSETPSALFETHGKFEQQGAWWSSWIWKKFMWKRQTHLTHCTIVINDSNNPALKQGPKIYPIPLTNQEMIRVIHRDPNAIMKDPAGENMVEGNASDFASLNFIFFNVDSKSMKENKKRVTIPWLKKTYKQAYIQVERGKNWNSR